MPGTMDRPEIRVEGENDQHSLVHILLHHGLKYDEKPWPSDHPKFIPAGGKDPLLNSMVDVIKLSTPPAVGFVLDADNPMTDRWNQVSKNLNEVGLALPSTPPLTGLIKYVPKYKTRVGIWLMPDNQRDGKIKDFLQTLIAQDDPLIELAIDSTNEAKSKGATFADKDQPKAVLNTWLAWQEEPGEPYGRAVAKRYFDHDHELAFRFVKWFKNLYDIA
ncbi:MAG: hypothetical protein KDA86_02075 [Planctomycetaceae bacterium]|nr:hypothetical protein [Planctomycetaceae bacterium]